MSDIPRLDQIREKQLEFEAADRVFYELAQLVYNHIAEGANEFQVAGALGVLKTSVEYDLLSDLFDEE